MEFSKDHRNRWITGVVGIIIVFLVVGYCSKPIFFIFMLLVNLAALKEFYGLVSISKSSRFVGIGLGLFLTSGFFYLKAPALLGLMAGIGFSFCLLNILKFKTTEPLNTDFKKHSIAIFIVTFFLSHLIWLRDLDEGQRWIFFLLVVIFTGDTFALYGGKLFGKHKLSPAISPKKTIEGSLAGLIGNVFAGLIFSYFFFPGFSWSIVLFLAGIFGILSQLGDLWESVLKRECMVKDSGNYLPGHGGFLDRLDSLFFSAPFLYYFIVYQEGLL